MAVHHHGVRNIYWFPNVHRNIFGKVFVFFSLHYIKMNKHVVY